MAAGPEPELESVVELLARTARRVPDQPAVTTGGRTWTYAQLWDGASHAAHSLQRQGVSPGENVMLALPNGAEFFLAFFGTLMAGGVAVPAFPRSTAERLHSLADLSGAHALIVSDSMPPDVLGTLGSHSRRARRAFLTASELGSAPAGGRAGKPNPVPLNIDQPCYLQYTSGSTADPRGVIITHRSLLANIAQMTEAMDITAGELFVSWLPTYHDMGLTLMALTPFSLGARLVLLPTDLRDVTGGCKRSRITAAVSPPARTSPTGSACATSPTPSASTCPA